MNGERASSRALARLVFLAIALTGCTRNGLVDSAMASAYRPSEGRTTSPYKLLAGDFHCHVMPADSTSHVSRDLDETLDLARAEGLDFVVLTPHVRARFFLEPWRREAFLRTQADLRASIEARHVNDIVVLPGFEYTDSEYGHVGVAFADPEKVLAEISPELGRAHPELFFEQWVKEGGVLVINHPLLTPLVSVFPVARRNLSWRPFTSEEPYPAEIRGVTHLAQGIEVYNLGVSHMRDGLLLGDRDRTLRLAAFLTDRQVHAQKRRIALVGGSDSHGHHLRATTFVLAEAKSSDAIRDAVVAGRTCVRSPDACSLEARPAGFAWMWMPVGSSLHASSIEVRAHGAPIEILENGAVVAEPLDGESVQITVDPAACTTVRARVGEGLSSPIYVNCSFAD